MDRAATAKSSIWFEPLTSRPLPRTSLMSYVTNRFIAGLLVTMFISAVIAACSTLSR